MYSLNKKIVEKQVSVLESKRSNIDKHLAGIQHSVTEISGFSYPEGNENIVFSGRFVNTAYKLEKYLIQGSGEYKIPLALFIPNKNNKREVILLLHEKGKNFAVNNDSLAKQLLAKGYTILLGDLPDIGEMGPGYMRGDTYINNVSYNKWFAGIHTGKSIVGLRAEDIIRMTQFIKTSLADYHSISAISVGVLGSALLHAAVFENDIQKVCLIRPFLSFSEIALSHEYRPSFIHSTVAGAIEKYDLPDMMARLCPRKSLIINPLSGNGEKADNTKSRQSMLFPSRVYSEKNASKNFGLKSNIDDHLVFEQVLSWLR